MDKSSDRKNFREENFQIKIRHIKNKINTFIMVLICRYQAIVLLCRSPSV